MPDRLLERVDRHLPPGFVLRAGKQGGELSVTESGTSRTYRCDSSIHEIQAYIDAGEIGAQDEWSHPLDVVSRNLFSVHVMEAVHRAPAEAERLVIGRSGLLRGVGAPRQIFLRSRRGLLQRASGAV